MEQRNYHVFVSAYRARIRSANSDYFRREESASFDRLVDAEGRPINTKFVLFNGKANNDYEKKKK